MRSEEKSPSNNRTAMALTVFTIVVVLLAGAIGLILHFTLERDPTPVARVRPVGDCLPENIQTQEKCIQRGCIWAPSSDGAPFCTFPDRYGYVISPDQITALSLCDGRPMNMDGDFNVKLVRIETPTLFGGDLKELLVSVLFQSNYRLRVAEKKENKMTRGNGRVSSPDTQVV